MVHHSTSQYIDMRLTHLRLGLYTNKPNGDEPKTSTIDLRCEHRERGEGQSVTIPVACTHQARAASLDDLTRRTPSWSEPSGRFRTEARATQRQPETAEECSAATIVTRMGGDASSGA